ncbi:transient receptor potential cation channel subfamily M member 3-like isoform X2 [Dreissena polymorpha]|uniref:transient receptor potential cation channel subfamily M member 3-like isoform X2 n=1 Tax=Dreissena polymorpha TaxID=45954 RepID=UPI00226539E0|nr:transient receptor potential cation channel subfamily M member 3-like isoform X2 [Dreissena polymorpha]
MAEELHIPIERKLLKRESGISITAETMKSLSARKDTILNQRVHPVDIDIMPSASVRRGMIATVDVSDIPIASQSEGVKNFRQPEKLKMTSSTNSGTMFNMTPQSKEFVRRMTPLSPRQAAENDKAIEEYCQFVGEHFTMVECHRFVPAAGQKGKKIKEVKCHCGAVLNEHAGMASQKLSKTSEKILEIAERLIVPAELKFIFQRIKLDDPSPDIIPQLEWSRDEAFRSTRTNAYGKIDFVNVEHGGGKKPAKYIRLSVDNSVDHLFEMMKTHWNIMEPQAPNLVISVVGGAKNFKLDGRNRTTFANGLIKTVQATSAWLISSGFNMGVMKAVGQAVAQGQSFVWTEDRMAPRLRCIGIAPWGYVRDRKCLEQTEEGKGCFYAKYRTSNVILHGEPVPLNADHTHFIFVDDGYRNRYGGVAKMRSKIEQKISEPLSNGGLGIPVVLVVVEGGTDAIDDAMSSVLHEIPVVVCSGTGRAADILAYAYSHTKTISSGAREISEKHLVKLREKIVAAYAKSWKEAEVQERTDSTLESVQKCCKNPDLLTVFNMNKHDELDLAILSVLLKSHSGADKYRRDHQLKLALMWNRVDIAREEIFREDVLWEQGSLDEVLTEAIVSDKVAFIKLILEQGVIMREFMTRKRLEMLYSKVERYHPIYKLLHKLTGRTELSLVNVAHLVATLLDRFDVDEFLRPYKEELTNDRFERPYKQLLIYAALLQRQELAKFCWEMGDEPVTSAIAVTRLYSALARKMTRDESSVRETVEEYKVEFETLATSVLNECYERDQEKAIMIVERKSPVWNELSALQIASVSDDQMFIASGACQSSIESTWKQGILASWKKVLMAMICPILIVCNMEFVIVGQKPLTWYQRLATFYSSPISKFCHGMFMFLVFLGIFSYLVLVDFDPDRVTVIEYVCIVWVFTMTVDQIHVFISFPSPTFVSKIRDWYGFVSYMEALNLLLCFLGFLLHHLGYPSVTKVLYCLNSVVFIAIITKFYRASTNVGPKMVMVRRMFGEMGLFLVVMMVFLLAYGIAAQGLLYTERSASWDILKDVFYFPYWMIYGEIFFESIGECDGDNPCNSTCVAGERDCLTPHWMVPFILAAYLMIGSILLLNLLIAIFSNVFNSVERNSFQIWKFEMYYLVMEYSNKTFLVPPLSILVHAGLVVNSIYKNLCCQKPRDGQWLGKKHLEYLQVFEKEMMSDFLRRKRESDQNSLDTRVQNLEKRVDMLTKLIEDEVLGNNHQPEFPEFPAGTIVMGSDGVATIVMGRPPSALSEKQHHPWPRTGDVIKVKDKVAATEIPAKVSKKSQQQVGKSAKLSRQNTVPNLKSTPDENEKELVKTGFKLDWKPQKQITSKEYGTGDDSKEDQNRAATAKPDGINNIDDDDEKKIKNDANVDRQMTEAEKEMAKQKRRAEKEERQRKRRERREEKRLRKEAEGLNAGPSAMNDVNQPGVLKFMDSHAGKEEKGPGALGLSHWEGSQARARPWTAPQRSRSPEVIDQIDMQDTEDISERKLPAWN